MIVPVECKYDQLPSSIQLPKRIHHGLASLWNRSTRTKTEWIGAATHSIHGYQILPLGHQAEGEVLIPIVNLSYIAQRINRNIDPDFVKGECLTSEWDIRHKPNRDGVYYRGSILYLLPRIILAGNPDLVLPILPPKDIVLPEEEISGVAHTHPPKDSLSHLPSLHDVRDFVLGASPVIQFELIISGKAVALLSKSRDTQHFEYNLDRSNYLNMQEMADEIELEKGRAFLDVLQQNCQHYRLGLYEGKLNSPEPLLPVFKNSP